MRELLRYHRKVIRITAEDSPNVQRGLAQQSAGIAPDGKEVVGGVLSWDEYVHRLATRDEQRKTVGLWAQFYEGKEVRLFPSYVLQRAALVAKVLNDSPRRATGIGVDPAEGGDKTTMVAGDALGVIAARSRKTPNTDVICGEVIGFAREMGCDDSRRWFFDAGGGGKQHVDRLRGLGFPCQAIRFGMPTSMEMKRAMHPLEERIDVLEDRYTYKNLRAEMCHQLALAVEGVYNTELDGSVKCIVPAWGIPDTDEVLLELHRQMSLIPKVSGDWSMWDAEGRIQMLPKSKKPGAADDQPTLTQIIGHSPDELDGTMLCHRAVFQRRFRAKVGVG